MNLERWQNVLRRKQRNLNLLFIAFELPPLASAGSHRPLGFIRHLREFGIMPIVVTTDEASYRDSVEGPIDRQLLGRLPPDVPVTRVRCKLLRKPKTKAGQWRRIFFSIVDRHAALWSGNLLPVVDQVVSKYSPAAIYVTLPPFSMGALALEIAERTRLPLLLDLRDAWSLWRISPYPTWAHYYLTRNLERRCLFAAARVIVTSEQTRADLLRLHPFVPAEKITVVPNGFDQPVTDWTMASDELDSREFVIGYVGAFYYSPEARDGMFRPWWRKRPNRMIQFTPRREDWLYRSPYFFFRALARLFNDWPEMRSRVKIRFAGRKPHWIQAQVDEFGLGENVTFIGQLESLAVLQFEQSCDALLITSSKVIGGRDYSIAGKTFEYFASKKPVFAFVTEGAQKDLLEKSGMAVLFDPDKPAEAASLLKRVIEDGAKLNPNSSFLNSLSRREVTRALAEAVRSIVRGENTQTA